MIRTAPLLLTLLLFWAPVLAQSNQLLERVYQPSRASATVAFYLKDIQQQTGIEISYSDAYLKGRRRVALSQQRISLEEALNLLLASTGLSPLVQDGRLMLVPGAPTDKEISSASTLSGFIRDSATREVVIGAIVYVPELQRGTATNTYGFYSLELPPGRHQVVVAAGGYSSDTIRMQLSSNLRRDVLLSYGLKLKEVTVSSRQEQRNDLIRLTRTEIAQHAGLLGENDVLRGLQSTAGVQAARDGSSNLVVRGGDPGQNLYLLDGVPLYYIDHMTGLTSVYNNDAVKAVDFYKGGFPSRYAGRLSSIIDVSSKDGDMKRFGGQASIGLLKGSLALEGPIVKDQASLSLTARRTWIDALWRPTVLNDHLGLHFYDINLKANWIIDPKNRIYISAYNGRDQLETDLFTTFRARWGNSVGSIRWTSALRPNLFLNTSVTYSRFLYELKSSIQNNPFDTAGQIPYVGRNSSEDISLRVQADYYKSNNHHLQFGLHVSRSEFSPADLSVGLITAPSIKPLSASPILVTEINLYAEHDWKPLANLEFRTGLHASGWLLRDNRNDFSLQPRFSADWRFNKTSGIFASAARMTQFLHLLSNDIAIIPADFWVPSTAKLRPEHAWTFAAGYRIKPRSSTTLKAEVYYKTFEKVVGYRGGTNIFESPVPWEDQLVQGTGRSYGIETELHQQVGPFRADIAYTLSRTTRRFAELNGGDPFPFRHDRRHCAKGAVYFQRRKRFSAVAEYTYMSGEAVTIPDQLYPDYDKNITGQFGSSPFTYNNSARNNYRMPPIQRLDLAVNFVRQRGKYFERTWTLGVYNFLVNHNVAYLNIEETDTGGYKLTGLSIFPFIPTISYAVRF